MTKKIKYTVYRGGSLNEDKLVIPSDTNITPYTSTNYEDLSDMELMSRFIVNDLDEEERINLEKESTKRIRKHTYEKYADKIGDIYIAKWKKAGLTNTKILKLLEDENLVKIKKLLNEPDDLKDIQKKLSDLYKILDKQVAKIIDKKELNEYIASIKKGYSLIIKLNMKISDEKVEEIMYNFLSKGGDVDDIIKQFDNNEINITEAKSTIKSLFDNLNDNLEESYISLRETISKEINEMKKISNKKSELLTKAPELLTKALNKEPLTKALNKELLTKALNKEPDLLPEALNQESVVTSSKKKKKVKTKATAEEVVEAEEKYNATEELSKQQEKEGNIRSKELRLLEEAKYAEIEEQQLLYEGIQHIKLFDKLFTNIFNHISSSPVAKSSVGKGHLFEDIMTKTNLPPEVLITKAEMKELNKSIKYIMTTATNTIQSDIPQLSSNFLPPNCSSYDNSVPYDLVDQFKNWIELKYYNTYIFGYKVNNGKLYETTSGTNMEVKSVQYQLSKYIRSDVDNFKIFYIRDGPNNYKIHNVYIKKDNNNKTINKPTNKEFNKKLTVIMAFAKSFYYFNPLELLTDDIMDMVTKKDKSDYKLQSDVFIPNETKLNFFINESLISIGDEGLIKNDTRIPFSYFKRI